MRIQHNIMAMNAYRNYNTNTKALSGNLEKLSSGYKINRAGDDAAGLAISEKMRAQITGLDAAQKNVKDGISLVKTAEGAMQEIQDMLNRMDYLATQSANGTYDDPVDRLNLNKEVGQLKEEINRIAESANFNGIKLLDGSWSKDLVTSGGNGSGSSDNAVALEMMEVKADGTGSIDGEVPENGKKATITISYATGSDLTALAAETIGGKKIEDLFDVSGDLSDLTTTSTTSAGNITLTAKTVGSFAATDWNGVEATINGADGTNIVADALENGVDVGAASAAVDTSAEYKMELNLSAIQGGSKFMIDGKTFVFTNDPDSYTGDEVAIDIRGLDLETGAHGTGTAGSDWEALKASIKTAVSNGLGTTDFSYAETGLGSNDAEYSFTATTTAVGEAANVYKPPEVFQNGDGGINADFKPGTHTDETSGTGKHATAVYEYDTTSLGVGDKIQIDSRTIEIVESGDEDFANGKISAFDTDNVNKALQSSGFWDATVEITDDKISVRRFEADAITATEWAEGNGKVAVEKAPEEPDGAEEPAETKGGKALTLQIGDTADGFNKLEINIGSMHTDAMGFDFDEKGNLTTEGTSIKDITIANQEGAAAAIQTIKNAINYVSGIRGDLGAYQNRLEHTGNNLSVMAENIQDAESTIRDTDVANEMMSYVKNNILVQSAQAMLAQANQVPQGVLQLLG